MINYIITLNEIDLIKHAIGLDEIKKIRYGKYNAYRNYFYTYIPDNNWEVLIQKGLADSRTETNGYITYFITKECFEMLSKIFMAKIYREYK